MVGLRPPEIWLISGPARTERNALALRMAQHLDTAAHIDGDAIWSQIVAGRAPATDEAAYDREYELAVRNQCLLARSYAEAGYTPVLDFYIGNRFQLDAFRNYLLGGVIRLVSTAGAIEGEGLAVAADAAVEDILERRAEALIR